jgi:hypothetical protein
MSDCCFGVCASLWAAGLRQWWQKCDVVQKVNKSRFNDYQINLSWNCRLRFRWPKLGRRMDQAGRLRKRPALCVEAKPLPAA